MQGLLLHSYRRCPFAIRVRMVLEEKGLTYKVFEEDLANPSPELTLLHPECKVPLLIHDGQAIHESAVITEYLEEAFPDPPLMPSDPRERARHRLWTFWANEILKPDLDSFKYQWRKLAGADRTALHERLKGHLAKLDEALASRPFLLGERLTLADIHVFPFYRQLQKSQPDFAALLPSLHLDAWLDRITSRPSFERVMAKPSASQN